MNQKKFGNALTLYARLFQYIRPYWVMVVAALMASILYSGVDAWFVYFLKPLLNEGLVAQNPHFLKMAPLLVLAVFSLRGISSFLSSYWIADASQNVIMHLRQALFAHLQRLPTRFYDHTDPGKIISVVLYSVEQVSNAGADVLTTLFQAAFLVIGLLWVMFSLSWKLTLLYFIIIPVVLMIARLSGRAVRRFSFAIQNAMGGLIQRASENIENYKVVRTFEGQSFEVNQFNHFANDNRRQEMKMVITRSLSSSGVMLVAAIGLSLILYIGSLDIVKSTLSAGGFLSFVAAMLAILKPMKDLSSIQNRFYRGLAGAQTVFEFLDQPVEVDTGRQPLKRAKGEITFSRVGFSYDDSKEVLQDVSFTVEPGQMVALVGRSGSGKSTTVNLLPRFYADFSGDILLDGVSITDYSLLELRRQFSIVSQQVSLFNDTVANNIAYGRAVDEADIRDAARAAFALDFIEALPNGMHTLVGENGVLLSGGQRQRIAIARAILKNAPILIFDEATASLDTESERYIQEALQKLMSHCTTLVIAHRLSTVEHADTILVFDGGRIVERGRHAELLAMDGVYAKLYKMQFKDN